MSLELADLTVRYGSFAAVRDVSLDIPDGEVFGLLGPSGSGKSTLLRAIAGLEPDVGGSVYRDRTDITDVAVHNREIGLVFQDGQLFAHRDVAGNVAFGLRMRGVAKRQREQRVAELLEFVGLSGYQRHRVSQLSGGQAQRVALARALAVRPRLLLLDEPLSGLDAQLREQLSIELSGLLRDAGITTMLVTHDQEEAFTLSDRVGILDDGALRQAGPVRDVWSRPADEQVGEFLGVTSVLPATAHAGVLRCALGDIELPAVPDGAVRLGLRPNALRLADTGTPGEVVSLVRRKDHVRLSVRIAGHDAPVQVVAGAASALQPGHTVRVAVDPDSVALIGASASVPGQALNRLSS